MKKKTVVMLFAAIIIVAVSAQFLISCTENQQARNYGGTERIELPKGEKLVMATWKGEKGAADLWFLTEPMEEGYVPKEKHFREHSGFGIWEGTVVFVESR